MMISGIIIRCNGIPEDFKAVSSLNSPILPKVIRAARSIARGRALGTKDSENWYKSSAIILKLRPLPASSSTYIQRNCKRRMISTIKNVSTSGPMNDFMTNLSSFFTEWQNLDAKLTDFNRLILDFGYFLLTCRWGSARYPVRSFAFS